MTGKFAAGGVGIKPATQKSFRRPSSTKKVVFVLFLGSGT
jgi:hypothetical protein